MVARSGIDHFLIQLYTRGGYAGLADTLDVRVRAGDICILDLSRTLRTEAVDYRNITLVVPRPQLEARVPDADSLHGLVLARELPLTAMLAAHIETLVLHARDLSPADAEVAGRATVGLIASLVEKHVGGGRAPAVISPLRQVLHYINTHLDDPGLGPARLIETFGLSRATLYRMFEREGGVAELIRVRRLTGAAIELGSPGGRGRRISEVARRWGFTDDSSFSRAFRAHFGVAPKDARSRSVSIWARPRNAENELDIPELAYWLRTLST
jgi:AraC-like DNA-binding protein